MYSRDVWSFERDTLTKRQAVAVLGFYVVAGLLGTTLVSIATYSMRLAMWQALLFGLAIPFAGIIISAKSDNWLMSTVGYLLVCLPFGVLVGPVVAEYQVSSVIQVIATTFVVTVCMWILGMVIPPIAGNYSGFIIAALLLLIVGDVVRIFMTAYGMTYVVFGIWDWVGVFLFTGLIVYDVNKAMNRTLTMDNMVDAAVGIYLDVLNLFLRLLSATGKKKD